MLVKYGKKCYFSNFLNRDHKTFKNLTQKDKLKNNNAVNEIWGVFDISTMVFKPSNYGKCKKLIIRSLKFESKFMRCTHLCTHFTNRKIKFKNMSYRKSPLITQGVMTNFWNFFLQKPAYCLELLKMNSYGGWNSLFNNIIGIFI